MISIALITYNGEKYIKEQLDSILNQTIQDFELVVCDDCSTDTTVSILQAYAQIDERIKVYENTANSGVLKNIEKAIKLCKGEFIALSDQDDVWDKMHLQVLYSNIGENYLVCADTLLVDEENNSLHIRLSQFYDEMNTDLLKNSDHLLRLLVMQNIFQGAAMMLNRKMADIVLPFPNDIKLHDLWFALCAMALDKFIYVPTIIIRHRRHHRNSSNLLYSKDAHFWNKMEYVLPLENLPNLNVNSNEIIQQSKAFFSNKKKLLTRHKAMFFWMKHYPVLYATNRKNRMAIRFWQSFFKNQFTQLLVRIKN